jgi:hypothetical protein
MLAFLGFKRGRSEEPEKNLDVQAASIAPTSTLDSFARKKRRVSTTPTSKGRRPRSVPPPRPVGSSRVNIKQVSLGEGYVVLTNDGRTGVSLDGWTLRSGATTTLTIAPDTTLEAHTALLVLAPDATPPSSLKNSGMKQLRATAAWAEGVMLFNADDVLIDGEGPSVLPSDSPLHEVVRRAEEYYRQLVSQLVAQRLFAKSPGCVGPSHVDATNVRMTHDAREVRARAPLGPPEAARQRRHAWARKHARARARTHPCTRPRLGLAFLAPTPLSSQELQLMLEGVADRILRSCKAEGRAPLTPSAVCVAIEDALAPCDVQRRALAECVRASEHDKLFMLSDEEVELFAATVTGAEQLTLSVEAVHTLAVALDYLLVRMPAPAPTERLLPRGARASSRGARARPPCCARCAQAELIETVATIAYSETTNGAIQGEGTPIDAELCAGALDKLALVTAVRMDPDLHKVFASVVEDVLN